MKLHSKLFRIQQEIGTLTKDKTNPFLNSRYFEINQVLEQLLPLLDKEKVLVMQPLTYIAGHPAIKTSFIDTETGEAIEDVTILPEATDPQKAGSAITYFRRYCLVSALGLQAEDDDANHASHNGNGQAKAKAAPKADDKPWLNPNSEAWEKVVSYLKNDGVITKVEKKYKISKSNREKLMSEAI